MELHIIMANYHAKRYRWTKSILATIVRVCSLLAVDARQNVCQCDKSILKYLGNAHQLVDVMHNIGSASPTYFT